MKSLKIFILLLSAHGQVLGEFINPCSNTTKVSPIKDFDFQKFSGIEWYDIVNVDAEREERDPEMEYPTCTSMKFSSTSDPYIYEASYSYYFNQSAAAPREKQHDMMQLQADHDHPAFTHYGPNGTFSMIILATDYETWAIFYGCYISEDEPVPFADIKSSTRTLEKTILDKLASDVENLGFSKENFFSSNQTDNCDQ